MRNHFQETLKIPPSLFLQFHPITNSWITTLLLLHSITNPCIINQITKSIKSIELLARLPRLIEGAQGLLLRPCSPMTPTLAPQTPRLCTRQLFQTSISLIWLINGAKYYWAPIFLNAVWFLFDSQIELNRTVNTPTYIPVCIHAQLSI